MARLDEKIAVQREELDCPGVWVSFSCSGVFTTKDIAFHLFDSTQMAYSLGKRVKIFIDDTRKHNGFCFGSRVDVLTP